ncbi:MAG: hypothetical protein IT208_07390 [Chthonomonadales bacterium]|nr:hypothetical protein [Chthonomonadales bacterium]
MALAPVERPRGQVLKVKVEAPARRDPLAVGLVGREVHCGRVHENHPTVAVDQHDLLVADAGARRLDAAHRRDPGRRCA